ncbi:DMT family transporter [Ideonella sp. BN130291]|uniref:DMT family transporter n=1 Tax=Ideonella sp. BN130291 TaxID=3112940 RepID=UPI002E274630|nr:multidrug efflux SMR transporter [Ideonella sp. BN130291]
MDLPAGRGIAEVVMALALKRSEGWTRMGASALGITAALLSIFLLTRALRQLPLATAYAIWTALGSLGVAAVGAWLLKEPLGAPRLLCIGLIVAGTAGLRALEG